MKYSSQDRSIRARRTSSSRLSALFLLFCRTCSRKHSTAAVSSSREKLAPSAKGIVEDKFKRFCGVSEIQLPAAAKKFFASLKSGRIECRAVALKVKTIVLKSSGDLEREEREEPRRTDNFTNLEISSSCRGILSSGLIKTRLFPVNVRVLICNAFLKFCLQTFFVVC